MKIVEKPEFFLVKDWFNFRWKKKTNDVDDGLVFSHGRQYKKTDGSILQTQFISIV